MKSTLLCKQIEMLLGYIRVKILNTFHAPTFLILKILETPLPKKKLSEFLRNYMAGQCG